MRESIVSHNATILQFKKPSRAAEGFTVTCPRCGTIHFKNWRAATQRGPFAELCGECLAWVLHQ